MMDHDKETIEEAWAIYRLRHPDVDGCDAKLALLSRYIEKRCGSGEHDPEDLVAEGLALLRKLDLQGSPD
jgi:hypothetical protein